jgi:L-rhamnose isomerase
MSVIIKIKREGTVSDLELPDCVVVTQLRANNPYRSVHGPWTKEETVKEAQRVVDIYLRAIRYLNG